MNRSCQRGKWLNEICSHMKGEAQVKLPANYWTKEKCFEESLKYKTRSDFQRESGSAHAACVRHKWMSEVCAHMEEKKVPNGFFVIYI